MSQEPSHDDTSRLAPATRLELKRVSVLFLLSAVTLLLFLVYLVAEVAGVSFIPPIVWAMWLASMLSGFGATWVYSVYVTARARRWAWVVLCALPPTSVLCAVAYAWIRRGELEVEIRAGFAGGAR